MKPTRAAVLFPAIYALALLLQIFYIFTIQTEATFRFPVVDSAVYFAAAEAFSRGDGLPPAPFRYGPLYPVLLGVWHRIAGGDLLAIHVLQALLSSLTPLLTGLIAARLFGRTTGIVAGLIAVFYWPLLYFGGELLIEPVFVPIFLLFLYLLLRAERERTKRSLFAAGLLLGIAGVARPNVLLLLPFLLLRSVVRGEWRRGVLFLGASALAVLPVTAHNAFVGKDAVLVSSSGGINFFVGNNDRASGRDSSFPGMIQWTFEKVRRLAEIEEERDLKPSEVSSHYFRKGTAFAAGDPGAFLALTGRKALQLFSSYEVPNVKDPNFYRARSPFLSAPFLLGFGVAAPLALAGLLRRRRRDESLFLFTGGVYALSVLLFFVNARYRLPLVPVFIVFAAAGLVRLARAIGTDRREAARLAVILVPIFLFVNWNPLVRSTEPSQACFNEGWASQKGGDRATALEMYSRIPPESHWFAPALNNRAVLLLNEGNVNDALAELLRAVDADSTYFDAWSNLGRVYYEADRYGEAAYAFEKAAGLWPEDPAYRTNLGLARKGAGDLEGAVAAFEDAISIDRSSSRARTHLSEILVALGREREALPHLEQLVREEPGNGAAWYYLGLVRERTGDRAGARTAWNEAILMAPDTPIAGRARAALGE